MLSAVEVDKMRQEFVGVDINLLRYIELLSLFKFDFSLIRRLSFLLRVSFATLALELCWGLSLFFYVSLLLGFFSRLADEWFICRGVFALLPEIILIIVRILLDHLRVLDDSLQIGLEPILHSDLHLRCALEFFKQLLVTLNVPVSHRVLDVSQQGVVRSHLEEPVNQLTRVEKVLGSFDVVSLLVRDVA